MRYSETQKLFGQAFEYPADRATVVDQLGEVELTAPGGESVTVRSVLERSNDDSYASADELYASLLGNLEDGFIGRKFYDDRGGMPQDGASEQGVDTI